MFFKKKTLEDFSAQREGSGMLRTLSTLDLTFLGIGLGLNTPIGPLRLDYGRGSQGGRVHFRVGGTF